MLVPDVVTYLIQSPPDLELVICWIVLFVCGMVQDTPYPQSLECHWAVLGRSLYSLLTVRYTDSEFCL